MTTIDEVLPVATPERRPTYATVESTVLSWLVTTDHKRIGILFFVATTFSLILGGTFALILRIEHLTPTKTIVSEMAYNRLFTLHGVIMVWLFMIPSIPTTLGNFLLPIQIGATEVAFPRLNLASFYIYVAGAALVLAGMISSGIDTGWTFYAPYSTQSPTAVVPAVLGVFILGMSSIVTGLNFITTVHTMRAEGITWQKLPLFTWAIYGTSIIQVLATPILGLVLLLTAVDHFFVWGIFDPARGGDPVLFQHLFWFYSHPAVYIMILPAMGVISEVVSATTHKAPLSYKAIVYSTVGIAFVGFLTWGHHMFVAGMSVVDASAFGILSMLVAIFSAIKVVTWVGTMYRATIDLTTPLAYVFLFLFLFVFGGMTGVAVATTSLDVHWHDTYFVVAHFHFIMVGGTLSAYLAGIHYWFPKVTGRTYSEKAGLVGAVLVFIGFFGTFVPQFFLGNMGMPRRYYYYDPKFQALHVASTLGSWVLAAGLIYTVVYLAHALFRGKRASRNPWGAASYEWLAPSPPPKHNFDEVPSFERGPYDYPLEGST